MKVQTLADSEELELWRICADAVHWPLRFKVTREAPYLRVEITARGHADQVLLEVVETRVPFDALVVRRMVERAAAAIEDQGWPHDCAEKNCEAPATLGQTWRFDSGLRAEIYLCEQHFDLAEELTDRAGVGPTEHALEWWRRFASKVMPDSDLPREGSALLGRLYRVTEVRDEVP